MNKHIIFCPEIDYICGENKNITLKSINISMTQAFYDDFNELFNINVKDKLQSLFTVPINIKFINPE